MESALKEWANEHQVEERTIQSFWINFESHRGEYPDEFHQCFGEFQEELLTAELHQISLALSNWPEFDDAKVVTKMRIMYNDKIVGEYRLVFRLDGQIDDDYYTLY